MIKDKNIAVFGLGVEGLATVNLLSKYNTISVFDDKAEAEVEKDYTELLHAKKVKHYFGNFAKAELNFDIVVRSSGVRPDHPKLAVLQANGAILTSATRIFFDECPAKIIGVTGTKGKGTTSTLIFEFLKASGADVHLAGNIGTPMLEILPNIKKESIVVLELSSFQLMDLKKSPNISVVLMTTSEHLDWHASHEEYLIAKQNIVKYQDENDVAIINQDFPNSLSFSKATKAQKYYFSMLNQTNGAYIKDDLIFSAIGDRVICKTSQVLLPGAHNLQNVMAAVCVAELFRLDSELIKKVLGTFKGLPHRLEFVGEVDGVKYYNDSFSTTPETAIAAIEAFHQPKVIILGGSSKNSDFRELGKIITLDDSVKKVILIGDEAGRIRLNVDAVDKLIDVKPKTMEEIVSIAKQSSKDGDVVLLSPACASFGMFSNYKDRGDRFREEIKRLAG